MSKDAMTNYFKAHKETFFKMGVSLSRFVINLNLFEGMF